VKSPWIIVPFLMHEVSVAFPLTPTLLRRLAKLRDGQEIPAEFGFYPIEAGRTAPYTAPDEPGEEAEEIPIEEAKLVCWHGDDGEEPTYWLRVYPCHADGDYDDVPLETLEEVKALAGLVKSPGVVYAVKVRVQRPVTFERTVYLRAYGGVPSNKAIDAAVKKVVNDDAEREGEEAVMWGRPTEVRVICADVDEMALAVDGAIPGP